MRGIPDHQQGVTCFTALASDDLVH